MRTLFAFFMVGMVASAVGQDQPVPVPLKVKGLLNPTLETWRKLKSDPKCVALGDSEKDYPLGRCSELSDQLGSQMLALWLTKGPTADEAIAAIFSFGLQKDERKQGHDAVCMAAARGSVMTKVLNKYRACELDISADYPKSMRSDIIACQRAIDRAIDVIRTHSRDEVCSPD
jgi:hypothetical protein